MRHCIIIIFLITGNWERFNKMNVNEDVITAAETGDWEYVENLIAKGTIDQSTYEIVRHACKAGRYGK